MKKIFLSIPSLWAYRNFIYSNVILQLKKKYDLIILIPENSKYGEAIKNLGFECIEYPINKISFYEKFLKKVINIKLIKSRTEFKKSKLEIEIRKIPISLTGKIFYFLAECLSILLNNKLLYYLYRLSAKDRRYDFIVNRIALESESVIIATNLVVKHELILFLQFSSLKNRKINFINSFDNTTSRGFMPFKDFNYHIVWNYKMAKDLIDIFGIDDCQIEILGTPQFDLLSYGSNYPLKFNDINYKTVENRQYILYCGGHYSILPFEVKIVTEMIKFLNQHIKGLNFIIRLHPLDDWKRWESDLNSISNVEFDYPWKQNSVNPLVSIPVKYEYLRHARILKKALLILNIASTTSLDCCVLNKAVYNLCFDHFNCHGELDKVYSSNHYIPIIESQVAPLIFNYTQLELIIKQLLLKHEPEELEINRINFAKNYCSFSTSSLFYDRFEMFLKQII
jgi:hypothetical protein